MQAPTWSLEPIFPGGVGGEEFTAALNAFGESVDGLVARRGDAAHLDERSVALIRDAYALEAMGHELHSFANCLASADTSAQAPRLAAARCIDHYMRMEKVWLDISWALIDAPEATREGFLEHPDIAMHRPALQHMIDGKRLELDRPLQELRTELEREALHNWGTLYQALSGNLQAEFAPPGEEPRMVGMASLSSWMRGHADESVRRGAFEAYTTAWKTVQVPCSIALGSITGERQTILDRCGADPLDPTLHRNRLQRETLEALLAAARAAQPRLQTYLARKAQLIGKSKVDFWDLSAPLTSSESSSLSWDDATELITTAFSRFANPISAFAQRALEQRWVEAERRDHKAQGGYCTRFPQSRVSRIYMTYGETLDSALTLAHELGHAYHNEVLFRTPHISRHKVTSALAETASTFCEAIVRDHAIAMAEDRDQRIAMLDQQLQDAVVFLMNIPARFDFERELYVLRRQGSFDPAVLAERMEAIQRDHYGPILGAADPMFWASKLHYYISHFGFYNWPYSFGYLFSGALYARARDAGGPFIDTWDRLLTATGWQDTEGLVRDFLDEDVTQQAFWDGAVTEALAPLDEFLRLTEAS